MDESNVKKTTEISTEIKFEVILETAHIIKVEDKNANHSNNIPHQNEYGKKEVPERNTSASNDTSLSQQQVEQVAGNPKSICVSNKSSKQEEGNKNREQVKADREARKLAKQLAKANKLNVANDSAVETTEKPNDKDRNKKSVTFKESKTTLTKAQRREIQETQRAAKAKVQAEVQQLKSEKLKGKDIQKTIHKKGHQQQNENIDNKLGKLVEVLGDTVDTIILKSDSMNDGNVKLFNHLKRRNISINQFINNPQLHPSIVQLGEQYAKRIIVGSNARCVAFLSAIKWVIQDYETPPRTEFTRSLETFINNCVRYLNNCRTLAVSVINAHKYIKQMLTQLSNNQTECELKSKLFNLIDTYIENQIHKAAQAINSTMQEKIVNGDVLLTFGCSSLVNHILEAAYDNNIDFRVIIVDSRPFSEGRELLRRLCSKGLSCTYVLINAISFVMPEVTKIILGAHALLANGYVMARAGTSQVALVAQSFNVPVLVCCETHKFSERFQTDAIVYNELDNPDDLVVDQNCTLVNWQKRPNMCPLNLNFDITPPELVNAVITEVAVLPCTSVPVILRMKPDWLIYAV